MKVKKQCSECDGAEIYTAKSAVGMHTGNLVPSVKGSLLAGIKVDIYVCGGCGCHQIFVAEEHLGEVREKWQQHV